MWKKYKLVNHESQALSFRGGWSFTVKVSIRTWNTAMITYHSCFELHFTHWIDHTEVSLKSVPLGPGIHSSKLSKLKLDHDHHRGLYSAHHDLQIPSGKHTNNYGKCPIYSELSHEQWWIFPSFFVCLPEAIYSISTSFCWRFLLFLWRFPPILAHRWLLSTWGHPM